MDQDEIVITEQFRNLNGVMNEIITSGTSYQTYLLKKIDTRKLDEKTEKVNDLIEHIKANDINKTNNLLKADST